MVQDCDLWQPRLDKGEEDARAQYSSTQADVPRLESLGLRKVDGGSAGAPGRCDELVVA